MFYYVQINTDTTKLATDSGENAYKSMFFLIIKSYKENLHPVTFLIQYKIVSYTS